jgi:hypothetical protein
MTQRKGPKAPSKRVVSALFAAALGAGVACGPSLKNVHEGTVRFEHCNRLDLDDKIAKNECKLCWSGWLAEYTYGQPRDRIDYARRRAKALSNGDEGARPVLKIGERDPEERQFYLVVPGPTSVHAPPPPVATVWKEGDTGDAGSLAKLTANAPPAESCADECRSAWQSCTASCPNGNGHGANGHAAGTANGNGTNKVNEPGVGADKRTGSVNGAGKTNGAASGGAPHGANDCSKCGSQYSTCMKHCFE